MTAPLPESVNQPYPQYGTCDPCTFEPCCRCTDSGHCRDKCCPCKRRDRECWSCGPLGSGLCTNFRPKISSPIFETIGPLPTAHSGSLPQTPNFIWGNIPGEIFTH